MQREMEQARKTIQRCLASETGKVMTSGRLGGRKSEFIGALD